MKILNISVYFIGWPKIARTVLSINNFVAKTKFVTGGNINKGTFIRVLIVQFLFPTEHQLVADATSSRILEGGEGNPRKLYRPGTDRGCRI